MTTQDEALDLEGQEEQARRNQYVDTHVFGNYDMSRIRSICKVNNVFIDDCEEVYDYLKRIDEVLSDTAIIKLKSLYDNGSEQYKGWV